MLPTPLHAGFPMVLGPIVMVFFIFGFGILGTIFWIWMLVDAATKEPSQGNDKLVWIVVIALFHWIGALIYFLARRPERIRLYGK